MIASYGERRSRCFAHHRISVDLPVTPAPPKFEISFFPSAVVTTCTCAMALEPIAAIAEKRRTDRIAFDGSTAQNRDRSFAPIKEDVDRYISQFKEGYFPPLSMLARLTEELGELARALSHREGFKKPKQIGE